MTRHVKFSIPLLVCLVMAALYEPSQGQSINIDLSTCGTGKGCFMPTGCTGAACPAYVTYRRDGDTGIIFEMARTASGYVAFGMNAVSASMGPATVLECARANDGTIKVGLSFNTASRTNARFGMTDFEAGITNVLTEFSNNILKCTFTWSRSASTLVGATYTTKVVDFTGDPMVYLLLAYGNTDVSGGLTQHTARLSTSSPLSLLAGTSAVGTVTTSILIRLHGSFMVIAWMLLASIGIFTARYYKDVWPKTMACGVNVWFTIHRTCMMCVVLFTILGLIVIFVDRKAWVDLSNESPSIISGHAIAGIIVSALAVLNPIMAACRPHPGEKNRPIFNWAHWGVGTAAHILGILTIFAGLNLSVAANFVPTYLSYILLAYVVFWVVIDIIQEVSRCHARKHAASDVIELKGPGANSQAAPPRSPSTTLRKVLFFFCVFITFVVGIVIVVTFFNQGDYP